MEILLPVLRIVHIVCGVFWAGTIFFFAWLLEPSVRAAGPEGGKVIGELIKRGYLNILPAMAILTVVSGGWLYWIVSGGLNPAWGHSRLGTTLTIGAFAGIVALGVGAIKMRPAGLRVFELAGQMATAESDEARGAIGAEMGELRDKLRNNGRIVAGLLLVAVVAMAVARYL